MINAYFASCGGRVEAIPEVLVLAVIALLTSKLIAEIYNNDKIKNKSKWLKGVAIVIYGGLALFFIGCLLFILYYGVQILISLYQFHH